VYLYGAKRANHGSYIITVDNQVAVVANSTSVGDDVFKQLLYGTSELTYGLHQVVFAKTADPGFIDLDFVTIETGDGNLAYVVARDIINQSEFNLVLHQHRCQWMTLHSRTMTTTGAITPTGSNQIIKIGLNSTPSLAMELWFI
jgi:hypothetical protein